MGYKNVGLIKRLAKKTIQKEIKKQEKSKRRKLNIEEKRKIKDKVFRKFRMRMALFGAVGLLGIGGIIGYNVGHQQTKSIAEGNETETAENMTTARNEFIKGIKVDDIADIENIEEDVRDEISKLSNPEEVLNYTKKLYVEEYNKNHEEKIDIKDVKIWKKSHDLVFYNDIIKSGESILRYCSEKEAKEDGIPIDGDNPIISITVVKEGKDIEEQVAQRLDGSFANIYKQDEDVERDTKTTLEVLGKVVLTGIDRATSMEQEGTSSQLKEEYKDRFIKAVTEYKQQTHENERTTDDEDIQL